MHSGRIRASKRKATNLMNTGGQTYDVKPIAHQSMIAPFYLTQLLQPHQVVYAMEEAHHLLIDAIHEARSDRTPESTLPTT